MVSEVIQTTELILSLALTFYKGKYTAARRTSPIPQLNCIGGSAQGNYQYEPEVVQVS
jgi:hypothetical protein